MPRIQKKIFERNMRQLFFHSNYKIIKIFIYLMNNTTEISIIPPSNTLIDPIHSSTEIKRKEKLLKHNSPVWIYSKFEEEVVDGEIITFKEWKMEDIFIMSGSKGTLHFKKPFKAIKDGNHVMTCLFCGYKTKYYVKSASCSSMLDHLKTHHSDVIEFEPEQRRKSYSSVTKCSDEFTSKANALLVSFLTTSYTPFNRIENNWFKEFVNHLNSNYNIPSKTSLSQNLIPLYVSTAKLEIKNEILQSEGVCVTTDGWSLPMTMKSFYSITIHYLFGNELRKRVLKLSEIREEHTIANLSKFINDTKNEWGLNERFGSIVIITDNASNATGSVEHSGNISVRCAPHTFDLAFDDIIKENDFFKELLKKCQRIAARFRKNKELAKVLEDVQNEMIGTSLIIKGSVETRFFSEYLVAERILKLKDYINGCIRAYAQTLKSELKEKLFLDSFLMTDEEEKMGLFFIETLKPFFETAMEISSDEEPTMSQLIPATLDLIGRYESMRSKLMDTEEKCSLLMPLITINGESFESFDDCEHLISGNNEFSFDFSSMITDDVWNLKHGLLYSLSQNIKKRFLNDMDILNKDHYLIATAINPCYKMAFFDSDTKTKAINLLKGLIGNEIEEKQSKYCFGLSQDFQQNGSELDSYMKEKLLNDCPLKDILMYWDSKKGVFPKLYSIARKYLCLLASSSSSERLFSAASMYYEKHRTRMLPSTLENECILKYYIEYNGIDKLIKK